MILDIIINNLDEFMCLYDITNINSNDKIYRSRLQIISLLKHPREIYRRKIITNYKIKEDCEEVTKDAILKLTGNIKKFNILLT